MAISTKGSSGAMAEINVTPLVDVLLVLLIIFMITAPILAHKIEVDLPQPNKDVIPPSNPPSPINLKIDQSGAFYWNGTPVDELGLKAQLAVIGQQALPNQPEIQIAADDHVAYEFVARVLADAKSYNLVKIGFNEAQ
ncbi:MAG: biopolymer transporter ExbD [Rhodanobacter sp.]|nr:MAG: biopolymer transporter ExbD [Rhodanobacter sp.]TAM01610.1 MAG: biopolymer transporter ExbD [Rhodanobacter sp.]TAM43034.1 MAG: biopolymer transporter ExbD [Rhodanobacter sp.]TAN25569.1 MAG: biopolymer transporter ExbD [Rhodanobacter sp.]